MESLGVVGIIVCCIDLYKIWIGIRTNINWSSMWIDCMIFKNIRVKFLLKIIFHKKECEKAHYILNSFEFLLCKCSRKMTEKKDILPVFFFENMCMRKKMTFATKF